ncbi:hypothetical protein I551_3752 [Mycobacterium ulcerans str. Harvey]|uniref:Uncharacterized protein n=1 Tax=Mycobacterium ulcerans str. Harvey TaxID=1299332 RepID=A0ABN0QY94_MYCUL|nr:hypothetical protein I551_3752 [Mycobacterium ulcerans str. Harvey]
MLDFGSADGDELVAWEFDHAGPTSPATAPSFTPLPCNASIPAA